MLTAPGGRRACGWRITTARPRGGAAAPSATHDPIPDRTRPTELQQELFDLFASRAGRLFHDDAHRIWRPLVDAGAKPEVERVTSEDFAVISLGLELPGEVNYESLGLAPAGRLASATRSDVVTVTLSTPASPWNPLVPAEVACRMFPLAEE